MEQRRTMLAIILCFGILLAWQKFVVEPHVAQQQQQASEQPPSAANPAAPSTSAVTGATPAVPPTTPKRPSQSLPLETSIGQALVGDGGRFFTDWTLKGYQKGLSVNTEWPSIWIR